MAHGFDISALGEDALLLRVRQAKYDEAVPLIHAVMHALSEQNIFDEIVPAYDSLMVSFDPLKYSPADIEERLVQAYEVAASRPIASNKAAPKILPICYGGEHGPDLAETANILDLSEAELITAHTAKPFLVCMLGFLPGFTYLSATPKALHIPRHDRPRLSVPAGSVGLAGWQTGIYALGSPGGWRIIGQTPLTLFNGDSNAPFHFASGDHVQFKAINVDEFHALKAQP